MPSPEKFPLMENSAVPGEIICPDEKIAINVGRKAVILSVVNKGDRPIQVFPVLFFQCKLVKPNLTTVHGNNQLLI